VRAAEIAHRGKRSPFIGIALARERRFLLAFTPSVRPRCCRGDLRWHSARDAVRRFNKVADSVPGAASQWAPLNPLRRSIEPLRRLRSIINRRVRRERRNKQGAESI
jgi:hypothetical protein